MTDQAPPPASADGLPPSASGGAAPGHDGPGGSELGSGPGAADAGAGPAAPSPYRVADAPPVTPAWKPSYPFLALVSIATLAADLGSKWWAKGRLEEPALFADRRIEVLKDHLGFTFARNRGGAWGLLQDEPESIRRPFFLGISVLAIVFIVSLYRKLTPQQWALRWGLPLVLGGAIGNLVNRIQYNYVVDFIDYQGKWVKLFNPSGHWPTFNVADIAIVVGVGLMAIDMFTPRKPAPKPVPTAASADVAREPAPFSADPPLAPVAPVAPVTPEPTSDAAPKET